MEIKITEAPNCRHCGTELTKYELPPVAFADGLGWGTTFLWICPSNQCPVFRKVFDHTIKHYGQTSSMRSIIEPDTGSESVIPAFTVDEEHYSSYLKIRREGKQIKDVRKQENKSADGKSDDDDFADLDDDY